MRRCDGLSEWTDLVCKAECHLSQLTFSQHALGSRTVLDWAKEPLSFKPSSHSAWPGLLWVR